MSRIRGFRGATTLDADTPEEMRERVGALVEALLDRNGLAGDDLVSALFTTTPDLVTTFPATAARATGRLDDVPLMGAVEQANPTGTARCVRVLLHAYSPRSRSEVEHVFLEGAVGLRPDLASRG